MNVRCIDCEHAEWERTPTGRAKRNVPGRCLMPTPDQPQYLCIITHKPHRVCVWPDYEGRCDGFSAKEGAS